MKVSFDDKHSTMHTVATYVSALLSQLIEAVQAAINFAMFTLDMQPYDLTGQKTVYDRINVMARDQQVAFFMSGQGNDLERAAILRKLSTTEKVTFSISGTGTEVEKAFVRSSLMSSK